MNYRFAPIQKWPRPFTKNRRYSPFKASYSQTLELLETELSAISARSVAIQLALQPRDIRNDGLPRSDARSPEHPGVILSFDKWFPNGQFNNSRQALGNYRPVSFPCDTFIDWKSNLRAIALSLEALRKVDRYGVTQSGEQYKGWAQLPAPLAPGAMTPDEAMNFIHLHSGLGGEPTLLQCDRAALDKAYRAAARKLHPDVTGGSHDLFVRLGEAKRVLEAML